MLDLDNFPYSTMRDGQKIVLDKLRDNWDKYRYFVLEIPTGAGKSAIAKTICDSYNKSFIVTATKQLQDQYVHDFRDIKSIKGKNNYRCGCNDEANCDKGPCVVNKELVKACKDEGICPYYEVRDRTIRSRCALTSYQYFLKSVEKNPLWNSRDVLILDECHLLEQQLTTWAGFKLFPRELHDKYEIFIGVDPQQFIILSCPPEESGYEKNKVWLQNIWELICKKRTEMFNAIEEQNELSGRDMDSLTEEELNELQASNAQLYELDSLYRQLSAFYHSKNKHDWIVEPDGDGLTVQPINVDNLFFQHIDPWANKKIIFMSATMLDIKGFCEEFNLPKDKTAIIKMDSSFDPKNSPIIFNAVCKMNYDAIEANMPQILSEVKEILDKHPNEKGIIHTSNYRITKAICENINSNRFIYRTDKESNQYLIKQHSQSKEPTVLVSPSLTTGADLVDDLSRFQIVVKLPWPSLQDKRVKKKIEKDDNWYACEMFKTFIQACGRSTRSEDDWSTTYVLDASFGYWVKKYLKWFPRQFIKRIQWTKNQ